MLRFKESIYKGKTGGLSARPCKETRKRLVSAHGDFAKCDEQPEITVNELLSAWLAHQRESVKMSTFSTYHNMVSSHIAPMIGRCKPRELNARMLEIMLLDKLKNGRLDGKGGLSAKTVQDMVTIIKSVAVFAKETGVPLDIGKLSLKLKSSSNGMKTLSDVEQTKLLQFIKKDIDPKKAGIVLCLYTGLRIGEVCALLWKDVCLESGIVRVTKTLQRISDVNGATGHKTMMIVDSPKSFSSVREIPIPSFVIQILKELKSDEDVCFLTGSQQKYIEPRTYENIFKSYIRQSGVKQTNFHTLRHTFATRCIECGMDVKSLSEILGHSDIKITLNTYVHPTMNMKRDGLEKLAVTFI